MPQEGVVLDGFLTYMDQTRKDYKLREPQFSLKQIEDDEIDSLNEIQGSVIKRNGSRIFSSRHPLLSGLKPDVYEEKIDLDTNLRWRIRPDSVELVLRKVIERALQTIVQLPAKDEKLDTNQELRRLAVNFQKLAEKTTQTLQKPPVTDRIHEHFRGSHEPGKEHLFRFPEQMQKIAETFTKICATTKPRKVRPDSPNPQTRFALAFVFWIEAFAGRQHYSAVQALLESSFEAAALKRPKWVDRLAREMNSKRQRRKALAGEEMRI